MNVIILNPLKMNLCGICCADKRSNTGGRCESCGEDASKNRSEDFHPDQKELLVFYARISKKDRDKVRFDYGGQYYSSL